MKQKVKFMLSIVASVVLAYGLSSCTSDGYSLDKMYGSIATVHADESGHATSFTLDNGQTMFVAATATNYKPLYERAVINYTILDEKYSGYDYAIKLNGYIANVLTKPIVYVAADDKEGQDELGYNKIKIFAITAKADYISIEFGYNMANRDTHTINLVALEEDKVQQDSDPIKLVVRHNINNDLENYASRRLYASFKLDEYIAANRGNENLAFEVSWTQYDGTEKTETLKYPLSPAVVNPPEVDIEE